MADIEMTRDASKIKVKIGEDGVTAVFPIPSSDELFRSSTLFSALNAYLLRNGMTEVSLVQCGYQAMKELDGDQMKAKADAFCAGIARKGLIYLPDKEDPMTIKSLIDNAEEGIGGIDVPFIIFNSLSNYIFFCMFSFLVGTPKRAVKRLTEENQEEGGEKRSLSEEIGLSFLP